MFQQGLSREGRVDQEASSKALVFGELRAVEKIRSAWMKREPCMVSETARADSSRAFVSIAMTTPDPKAA